MTKVSYQVQKRYADKALKKYTFRLHKVNDSDVIEKLDSSENKTELFRKAIRNYKEKEAETT